jgi:hypothetical protein
LAYLLYIAIIATPVNNKKHKKNKKVSFGTKPQPTGTAKTTRTIVLVTGDLPGGEVELVPGAGRVSSRGTQPDSEQLYLTPGPEEKAPAARGHRGVVPREEGIG